MGKKLEQVWDGFELFITRLSIFTSLMLVVTEIAGRNFFKFSIFWVEEWVKYLIILAVMTSSSRMVRHGGHVGMSLIYDRFSDERKTVLRVIYAFLGVFVSGVLLFGGKDSVLNAMKFKYVSETLARTPMWIPFSSIFLGGALMTLSWIRNGIVDIRKLKRSSLKDPFTYLMIVLVAGFCALFFTDIALGVLLVGGLLFFTALGFPIAFSLGLTCVLSIFGANLGAAEAVAARAFWQMNKFTLLAIPFFGLAAQALVGSRLGKDVFDFARATVGHIRGGLGMAVAGAAALFAALSGSTIANTAALGGLSFEMLTESGYPKKAAAGLIGASGTLAPMIPPSGELVMYASISGASVATLLLAGIVPGIFIALLLGSYSIYQCYRGNYGKSGAKFSWSGFVAASKRCIWALLMPLIILGAIYSGIASPTESAALGALYGLIITGLVYRSLNMETLNKILDGTAHLLGMVFMIILFSGVFGFVLTSTRIPVMLTQAITQSGMSGTAFLMVAVAFLFLLGCFMGSAAIMLVVVPILLPIVQAYGLSPIHFGILVVGILETSFLTPPVGSVLYVMARVTKMKLEEVISGTWAYCLMIVAAVVFIALFPQFFPLLAP